jgi:hypothetical protein
MNAAALAKALGGDVAGRDCVLCPGPGHSGNDRSLSVTFRGDDFTVHSFSGDDWQSCRDYVRERLGLPAFEANGDHHNAKPEPRYSTKENPRIEDASKRQKAALARRIWVESVDPRGTFAEDYLASRGLYLPKDPEILLRTIRFHLACPFPDGCSSPALIAAFTPILSEIPDDPFDDPPPTAIHRIRGRGRKNKAMLAPVTGKAIMLSPWWHVWETLHVCEGIETALALYNEGAADPEDCRRPIWALGSAGAIRTLEPIGRVKRLIIWADNDASGTGLLAAQKCAERWEAAGHIAVIRHMREPGDYADSAERAAL